MTAPTSVQGTTYSARPAAAFAGLVTRADVVEPRIQGEASAVIPFGYGVVRHASDTTKAVLPSAETDKVLGLVCRLQQYDATAYDLTATPQGIKPGYNMDILRRGRMWVLAEDAVAAAGDNTGWVRCTAGGAGEYVGGVTTADEGTETIDCTKQIEFQAAVAAGELVEVEVDFTRKP